MGSAAATIVSALSAFLSLFWLIVICWPGRWHYEDITMFYIFDIGLYSVNVKKGGLGVVTSLVGSKLAERLPEKLQQLYTALSGAANSIEGDKYLADVTNAFCAIRVPGVSDELCSMWARLQYSGWAMMFCGILTVMFLFCGAGFSHYFWNTQPTQSGRSWTKAFFALAPISGFCGVAQYFFFTMDFRVNFVVGGDELTFDFVFFMAACLSVLTCVPGLVNAACSGMDQVKCQDSKELGGFTDASYGATAYAEAGMAGGGGMMAPPGAFGAPPPGQPDGMYNNLAGVPPPPMSFQPPAASPPPAEGQFRPGPSSAALA